MKLKHLLLATAIGLSLISGCNSSITNSLSSPEQSPSAAKQKSEGPFTGKLPCADCPGIETSITFYFDTETGKGLKYSMIETYIDQTSPLSSQGEFVVTKDGDKTLYHLDPDNADLSRYFAKIDNNTIEQLDKNGKKLTGTSNHLLTITK